MQQNHGWWRDDQGGTVAASAGGMKQRTSGRDTTRPGLWLLGIVGAIGCSAAGGGDMGDLANADSGSPNDPGSFGDGGGIDVAHGGDSGPAHTSLGPGGVPFDPSDDGSSGVKVDPKGDIVIDPAKWDGTAQPIIWISNSVDGTISKVDTRTMKETARYRTGPDASVDPSRTTVSLDGDVVVLDRHGNRAVKIAANILDCVGPGTGTSTGPADLRAWGDDKCIVWNTKLPDGILGRGAAFDAERGLDGTLSTSVWVGQWDSEEVIQLDSKTGAIKNKVKVSPVKPYGIAVDANHHVWVWGGGVGFIRADTAKWTQISTPPYAYGIAVDPKGRVWTSGGNGVSRYTPPATGEPIGGKWDAINVGASNRGLAVDNKGSVWVADTNFGVHQIDEETMAVKKDIPLGGTFVGMAIDFDNKVWAIDQSGGNGFKIDPATYAVGTVKVGNGPYTYSDMTGYQLRNAASPFGKYRHLFAGCGNTTRWTSLSWIAHVDAGTTSIAIRVRTGKDPASTKAAPWKVLGTVPPLTSPVDLGKALGTAAQAEYLEVEFELDSTSPTLTPILSSIDVSSTCPPSVH